MAATTIDAEELVVWICGVDPLTTPLVSPFGIQHVVNATELLDYIHEQTEIPKETIGEWVERTLV